MISWFVVSPQTVSSLFMSMAGGRNGRLIGQEGAKRPRAPARKLAGAAPRHVDARLPEATIVIRSETAAGEEG